MPATPDYLHLFRLLPHSYLLLLPDGTVVDNSDKHVGVSMLPREQAAGRNIFEAYPSAPESQRELHESHEYVRQHKQPHTMPLTRYDLQRPAQQGGGTEERYWRITHYPVLDDNGQLLYILQHPEDVTTQHAAQQQRQAAEQALLQTRQQALFTLDVLPVMVWTAQPDGTINYFNQRWRSFTGIAATEGTAQSWQSVLHPDDLPRLAQEWAQAIAARRAYEAEFRMRRHSGHYRWVLARTVPQLQPDGSVGLWVGSGVDIHEQKLLVQELTEANEQQALLSEQAYQAAKLAQGQRETFYTLFMQAPALIAIVRGPHYTFEFANPAYHELFATDSLLGRTVLEVIPDADEQGFMALLNRVYETGEPFVGSEMPLLLHRRTTGQVEERYFDFSYQAFRENGRIVGIFSFAFDVTERVLMRQRLQRLQELPGLTTSGQA